MKQKKSVNFRDTGLWAAVIAAAAVLLLLWGVGKHAVIMSAEEYERYSRFMALEQLADRIEEEFYADVPSRDTLIAGAASGMIETLNDPYARYYTAEEYEDYMSSVNGEYYGIGLLVGQSDERGAPVLEVYDGSTSEEAGIKAGDVITHVNGESAANMLLEELSAKIDESKKDGVLLTLSRNAKSFEVTVKGGSVTVGHVEHKMLDGNVGYIAISMFSGNCEVEFAEALDELQSKYIKALVLDLRNNPGGSLNSVVEIADTMLGKDMRIVSVGPADTRDEEIYDARGNAIAIPIAVLVNGQSASASEILAAALQENGVGKVVGTKTYGKGIVQTTMYIEDMAGWLKLTTDAYYTPDGGNIHGEGIDPDIYAELPEEYRNTAISDIPYDKDTQLQAALNSLREK